jgi:hypothetical protein
VFIVLLVIFFVMIFLIVLSAVTIALMMLSVLAAWALGYISSRMGGSGTVIEMIRATYYSTAAALSMAVLPVLACITKAKLLSYPDFVTGINIVLAVMIFYFWGLWSIALRKVYKISRIKAVMATLIVIILMILLQMFVSVKLIPKLEGWIS